MAHGGRDALGRRHPGWAGALAHAGGDRGVGRGRSEGGRIGGRRETRFLRSVLVRRTPVGMTDRSGGASGGMRGVVQGGFGSPDGPCVLADRAGRPYGEPRCRSNGKGAG